jgi:transposase
MSTETTLPTGSQAQKIVSALMDRGYSAMQIADLLDGRVSWRTVYRWAKGESSPQRPSDAEALRSLESLLATPEKTA